MLNQKDLDAIRSIMKEEISASEQRTDEKIQASEKRMIKSMDEKIQASEKRMLKSMDEKIAKSENMVLRELDRVQEHLERKIERVSESVEELRHTVNAIKMQQDNTAAILKMYENLEKRVEVLEQKTA